MNQAVGTTGFVSVRYSGKEAVDGPWLDGNHGHRRGDLYRTYARLDEMVDPEPERLCVFIGEDDDSINDGGFGFSMADPKWIDSPATRHDTGATFGFADGHAEIRHWMDPRTVVVNHNVSQRKVPGSPDYAWMRARISARIPGR